MMACCGSSHSASAATFRAPTAALSTPRSTAIWPYRVPSLIGAAVAALLTFAFGQRLLGDTRAALTGAVLLAASLGVVAEAHIAKTDAMLLATITMYPSPPSITFLLGVFCLQFASLVGIHVLHALCLVLIRAFMIRDAMP